VLEINLETKTCSEGSGEWKYLFHKSEAGKQWPNPVSVVTRLSA